MKVTCCFCNTGVESKNVDPCEIIIQTNWNKSKLKQHDQSFWCHLECFKGKMHDRLKQHLLVHLLSDKEELDENHTI